MFLKLTMVRLTSCFLEIRNPVDLLGLHSLSLFLAQPRLIGELLVYRGIRRPSVVNIFKRLLL